jgi:Flp pilus assembly protein TadG
MQSILGRFKLRLRKAGRDEKGAAMIEFAIIAAPFLGLLFGMLEVGLIFWGGYELDNATLAASRLIKTGQAQSGKKTQQDMVTAICNNVAILSGCASSLTLTVQTVSSFACVADPSQGGCTQSSGADGSYNLGKGSQIQLVTAKYELPLFNFATMALLANQNGKRVIQSTAVFQNEPF